MSDKVLTPTELADKTNLVEKDQTSENAGKIVLVGNDGLVKNAEKDTYIKRNTEYEVDDKVYSEKLGAGKILKCVTAGTTGDTEPDWEPKDPTPIPTPGGRSLYRHPSNMGTVMVWNDNGTEKHTLVLDAMYRTKATTTTAEPYTTKYGYPTGTTEYYKDITDEVFNTDGSTSSQDTLSSKDRTDLIATTSDAAIHCRQQLVDGIGCDFPNINCLVRIYSEREQLDALDPTVSEYSDYALTNWFKSGDVWSSSSNSSSRVFLVLSDGKVSRSSDTYSGGVVPVLDLNASEKYSTNNNSEPVEDGTTEFEVVDMAEGGSAGGLVDDVKVDGTSVVVDRVANVDLSGKQDVLTAGTGIAISGGTISNTHDLSQYAKPTDTNFVAGEKMYYAGDNGTINLANGLNQIVTAAAITLPTPSDTAAHYTLLLYCVSDNIVWSGDIIWPDDKTPTLGTGTDVICFTWVNGKWLGSAGNLYDYTPPPRE